MDAPLQTLRARCIPAGVGRRTMLKGLAAGLLSASVSTPFVPISIAQADGGLEGGDRVVRVMTQNMDEGSDFGPILTASTPQQLVAAVTATYLEVQASKIAERAAAVAREIAATLPDLIGLQEVSLWRTGPYGAPATTIAFDALQSLLDALQQRGLPYTPIGIRTGLDAEAPSALGFNVRLTDRDVLLARTRERPKFTFSNVQVRNFVASLVIPNPLLGGLPAPRGWISVDAMLDESAFRFVTTHLDGQPLFIQLAQANELLQGPANTPVPVVIAGDFNASAAGGPDSSAAYHSLIAGGLVDAWAQAHPADPGFTWPLHGEDPFTPSSIPTERIDLVLVRGNVGVRGVQRVGASTANLTPSGLWPSDHAGIVARLQLPNPSGGPD